MTLSQAKAALQLAQMEVAANPTEQNQEKLEAAQTAYDELSTPPKTPVVDQEGTEENAGASGKEKVETDPNNTPGADSAAGSDPEKKSND